MNRTSLWSALAAGAVMGSAVVWLTDPPAASTGRPAAHTSAASAAEDAQLEPATALDGASLFQAKSCAGCHTGPDSTATVGLGVPPLDDAASWAGDRRPGMTAEGYLTESILEPWAFDSPAFAGSAGPVGAMPALDLTEAEVSTLVDYLLSG